MHLLVMNSLVQQGKFAAQKFRAKLRVCLFGWLVRWLVCWLFASFLD